MKALQDPQGIGEASPSLQVPHNSQNDRGDLGCATPIADSAEAPSSSNGNNKKVSREDIELVQNLIERCLVLYMNRNEVVAILKNRAKIEPGFTSLVWQKLEEENADFFKAYYVRLKLKKQILLFNNLLEHQCHLMKYPATPKVPLASMQNGVHSMPVNNVPMGYPVLQQPAMSVTGQPHLDSMGLSHCHVVNGVPAPGNFNPIRVNSGNDVISSMSEMAMSPTSVASNGHFPFTQSDILGIGTDSSALDSAFTSDVGTTGGLPMGIVGEGSSKDSLRSGEQLPWNLSLADLTAEFTNLEDLGALGNYTGSPFLPETDMMLDMDEDDIVDDYFVDNINGLSSQSDEDKS
uniref:Inositol monophosphatase 1 n=2 Tax=Anthurium amnicola TaxID=1678845 RepID=A0A1D1XE53_9ARAE